MMKRIWRVQQAKNTNAWWCPPFKCRQHSSLRFLHTRLRVLGRDSACLVIHSVELNDMLSLFFSLTLGATLPPHARLRYAQPSGTALAPSETKNSSSA